MKHWKSGFFLIDRRAIPDAMVWRHPDAAIDDPRPAVGSFNVADVRCLSAHVIKLRDMPDGVLVLSGLSLVWKNRFCDPVLQGADGNGMGVGCNCFALCPWLLLLAFIDLAAGTPSSKILGKAKASQKRKASTSGAASSHVAKRTSDDDDASVEIPLVTHLYSAAVIPSSRNQGGSSIAPTAEGSNTRDSRGKGTMVDGAAAPSGGMSVLHCMMMSHGGELLARYRGLNQSHHEYVLSTDSRLKGYEEKVAGLTGLELQVSTLKKQVSGLNDKLATSDASFAKSKAKGKERKMKIKSLSKSLDNLHSEVARLSAALNQATILEAERDEEILRLKATPLEFSSFFRGQFQGLVRKFLASDEFSRVQGELLSLAASAGFEHGLSMHQTKDEFADVLKKMYAVEPLSVILQLEHEKLVRSANVPIPKDTRVSPPIAKESTVTPNEEQVSAAVDGSDLEMTDGAAHSKSGGVFVKGTSHVLDDIVEMTMVGSERVSFGLTDVVVALSAGEKGDGSAPSTVEEFGFAPSALLVVLPFLLLLVSSTDGLVLIPTDTSWLRNSSFIVASPVNTSAF
ncbi:hypothetical protein Tco_0396862, partial [Tanacetum coccineum]